jgi:hypothetical protein
VPNRIIKESICTSDNLNLLSPDEEVFFYRLLVNCDDFGRFDARPEILRARLYPLRADKEKLDTISKRLLALYLAGLITLYQNNNRSYLEFCTWEEHQHRRANNSKYPGPYDEGSTLLTVASKCEQIKTDSPVNVNENRKRETRNEKRKRADFVFMTDDEYQKLVDKFGESVTNDKIEALNLWKGSKGKQTASDYMTILNWDRREKKSEAPKQNNALEQEAAKIWHSEVLRKAGPIKVDWSSPAVLAGVRRAGGGTAIAETRTPEILKKQFIDGYIDYKRREAG